MSTIRVRRRRVGGFLGGNLTIAYNDIKDRKGVMIDDNFVKETKKEITN